MQQLLKAVAYTLLVSATLVGTVTQGQTVISRQDYAERLHSMWLAECIANWTGRITEGWRTEPPFFDDSDWDTVRGNGVRLIWVFDQDPWKADDDTDIEYVYINEMSELGVHTLTGAQIRQAWIDHINDFIWVSNDRARTLMDRGMEPPSTGLPSANQFYRHIDAQLTTEVFGALAPGMPHAALEIADLPIAVTARTHAEHASRFHVVLYSLAPVVDQNLPLDQQVHWIVESARQYIPDTSKAADIIDTVYADYLSNPDPTDWERTRDLVYDRYQLNASTNGFQYRGWTESSVNFACGLIALLYGKGNFPETIRIGTLTGWDSDNGTATMGGLLGLMLGPDELVSQIHAVAPGQLLSDRYWISRTRDAMPDYLPGDPDAEDSFDLLAARMLPIIDSVMKEAGAGVGIASWIIPDGPTPDPSTAAPNTRRWLASANHQVRLSGGSVSSLSTAHYANPNLHNASGSHSKFANASEHDDTGVEPSYLDYQYYASRNAPNISPGDPITLQVTYSIPVTAETLRFIEGEHTDLGGWFIDPAFEIRHEDQWIQAIGVIMQQPDPLIPFETIDFILDEPSTITGLRITGEAGGAESFVTAVELDALDNTDHPDWPSYDCIADVNFDGAVTPTDFTAWINNFNAGC